MCKRRERRLPLLTVLLRAGDARYECGILSN